MGQAKINGPAKVGNILDHVRGRLAKIDEFRKDRANQRAILKANRETLDQQLDLVNREIAASNERESELRSMLAATGHEQPETPKTVETLPHVEEKAETPKHVETLPHLETLPHVEENAEEPAPETAKE